MGIDAIICISVNDPFVMQEWTLDQQAKNITFVPDVHAEFTRAMGMLVNKENLIKVYTQQERLCALQTRGRINCSPSAPPIVNSGN